MQTIKLFETGILISLALTGCKQASDSSLNAASRSSATLEANTCNLSAAQMKLISTAGEFSALEKVSVDTLSADEKTTISKKVEQKTCSIDELLTLTDVFPSIASKLSNPTEGMASNDGLALGGDMSVGSAGVVRTDYILIPKTGTRYIAGYNSDGIIVLLQRLMQTRPR